MVGMKLNVQSKTWLGSISPGYTKQNDSYFLPEAENGPG